TLWFGTKLTETIPKPHSVVEFPLSAIMLKAGHSMGCKFPDKSNIFCTLAYSLAVCLSTRQGRQLLLQAP
ncbi:hypothetical protein, partial [Pantanalinema sp. GBBB05]|uniref:hypothetical protein n=1 Tax=Pantanalinema sp. GBBB05 TaxID=2604139 RepID=UPI003D815D14